MDLGCSICQESFSASSTCVATKCGHVFHKSCQFEWMKNSKTCPSCRASCNQSALIRIFFTSSLSDPSQVDVESLRNKLDTLEGRVTDLTKQNTDLKTAAKSYKERNIKLDDLYHRSNHQVKTLIAQLKDYDAQKARADAMSSKLAEMSSKLEQMKQIELMLNSSAREVESFSSSDTTTLSFLVVTLKRELEEAESRRTTLFSTNCKLNNMLKQKSLEVENLQDQLATVQSQIPPKRNRIEADRDTTLLSRRLSDPEAIPVKVVPKLSEAENSQSSPYLRLASSSVGLTPLLKKPLVPEGSRPLRDNLQKLSIFQPGRLTKTAKVDVPQTTVLFKENDSAAATIQEPRLEATKINRFNLDARLKSGAIKRPRPGSHQPK